MKERKSFPAIVLEVKQVLTKEKELSIRQISTRTKSQWRTIEKALGLLKALQLVKERPNKQTERIERLFSRR